jgi:hypothetical protein
MRPLDRVIVAFCHLVALAGTGVCVYLLFVLPSIDYFLQALAAFGMALGAEVVVALMKRAPPAQDADKTRSASD